MRRFWWLAWLLFGCGREDADAPAPQPAAEVPDADAGGPTAAEEALFNRLRGELEETIAKEKVPGAAFAVVLHGKLAFATGVGVKREGASDPVGPDTLFRVASMTKPIVAAGTLQLVEQGKIDLARPIRDYVPGFRRTTGFDPKAVHFDHLLTHVSGIPDEGPRKCSVDPSYMDIWLASRASDPYWSPPGALFNYSNANFALAAMAVQKVTATPFHVYLKEHVLVPAGMETATFDPAEASEDRTSGHLRTGADKGKIVDFNAYDCAVSRSYMGIVASAKDYAHLAEKLIANGEGVLAPESLASMEGDLVPTGMSDDYKVGYGLFNMNYRGDRLHSHDGRAYGWESWFGYEPSRKLAVVVLVNADGWGPASFGLHALDAFNHNEGYAAPDWSTPRATWKDYVGSYADPWGELGNVDVTWNAERLYAHFPDFGDTVYEMFQVGGDAFAMYPTRDVSLDATFFRGSTGTFTYFATRSGVAVRTATSSGSAPFVATPSTPPTSFADAISVARRASHWR